MPSSKRNSAGLQEFALRLCFDFRRGPEHLPRGEQLFWAQRGAAGETPLDSQCVVFFSAASFPQMFNTSAGQSFDRLYGRAIRGACYISNCFLEGQFVSTVSFFCAKTSELSGAAPLCLFVICCSEPQNVFEAALC